MRIRTLAIAAVLALSAATFAAFSLARLSPPELHGTDLGPGVPAADFTLQSAERGAVSLADLRGDAVLLFFGYTTCPDVCPLTMGKLRQAVESLGEDAADVQVALISVDPELDTPERVQRFVANFHPDFLGLTGTRATLQQVAQDYGVYASEPETNAGAAAHADPRRVIAHSSYVFGITRDGEMRILWDGQTPADEIAADVRALLRL